MSVRTGVCVLLLCLCNATIGRARGRGTAQMMTLLDDRAVEDLDKELLDGEGVGEVSKEKR